MIEWIVTGLVTVGGCQKSSREKILTRGLRFRVACRSTSRLFVLVVNTFVPGCCAVVGGRQSGF